MRPPGNRDPVNRRAFLRTMAAASAAAAAASVDLTAQSSSGSVQWKKAPCRLCGVGCGLLVGIQNGRAVAMKGDPSSPVSRGLACVKGYHAIQALYGRDRITRALVRRNGSLQAVARSDALDLVAQRLRDTLRQHGPGAAAVYGSGQWTAEDAMVATRLFRETSGMRAVDTSARLTTASADAALRLTFGQSGPPGTFDDIESADVFVLWDVNLAETDPVLFSRLLERRRTNPAVRIIDLATRTSRTSYAADRSLLYVPATETAIANAICQEMIARRLANRAFVDRYVAFKRGAGVAPAPDGAPLVTEAARPADWNDAVRFLSAYTPERARQLSGLAADEIRWLASLYGDPARTVMTLWGWNVNRQHRGTWANNALHNVHLLAGKVASPGNAALCVTGLPGGASLVDDAADAPPDGVTALGIFRALERGEIRFLWIQASNPMLSLPHLDRYRAAANRTGAFIAVSECYPTATTDVADVVLPAALWIEREGIHASPERRVQHVEQLVRPPGDCLSDAEQMIEVARRLGHGALFPASAAALTPAVWNELGRRAAGSLGPLPTLTALRHAPGLLWPMPGDRETRWRYNTRYDPAADPSRGAFDFHGHEDHRAWFWLRPHEAAAESPDREYPFWFSAGPVVEHWGTGTLTRRIPTLHRAVPAAYVELNARDAQALRIRDGDRVRLTSRRGSVEARARIDGRGQPAPGRVFAPAFDESVAVNRLAGDAQCPISGQPDHAGCAVRVERIGGER